VQAHPQPPGARAGRHPPIVMGGRSPAAYRRSVTHANGWYGFNLSPDDTAEAVAGLRRAKERYPRPPELGELEVSVTPRGETSGETVERFAALGVDRLILRPTRGADADAIEKWVAEVGTTLLARD
jgi:alkanesulfonate monooxygenase SsuD/methylene tetrahydromethanopterin reductase-like flavin-dependent oxidoreductase (luciferase family)